MPQGSLRDLPAYVPVPRRPPLADDDSPFAGRPAARLPFPHPLALLVVLLMYRRWHYQPSSPFLASSPF